ncbi:MAG: chloride channel protein [Bacteroidota bacterium]
MQKRSVLKRFLIWRIKNITNSQFMIFLSIIVGLCAGIAAFFIKKSVFLIQLLLTNGFDQSYGNYLYFIYPSIGILLVILFIKYLLKRPVNHGIPSVLYAISKSNGIIRRHNMFSSIVSSAITVGFGGSVGLEGPTVATGAAFGSNIGRLLRVNYKQIILLLGCACAGAMAAIFKAPIAAIVFAIEVIMLDLTMASLMPLLLASVSAALTSYLLMGQNVLYPVTVNDTFQIYQVPFYILLGIFTGLISVYFTKVYMFINKTFESIKKWYIKILIGGVILGGLIFLMPSLYGEGYEVINSCLHGNYDYLFNNSIFFSFKDNFLVILLLFFMILLFKVVATAVTFGSGGIGGIFAPSLFLGANAGLLFVKSTNLAGAKLNETSFALVGMAGLIAGVIHAPLTAIFLIAEITGGYQLFMPLMITAALSYGTVKLFTSNSVYTIELAKRGELMTHDKDKAVMSLLKVEKHIETNFKTIDADSNLRDLVGVISKSSRNIYPVVDKDNNMLGIIFLDHIRHIMFRQEMYDEIFVRDLMYMPSPVVDPDESMEDVAAKFQQSGNFNLPVVKDGKYLGFVSRANIFSSYIKMLKEFSED